MRLYAQRPDLRLRQALGDTGVVAWIVLWVLVARAVHRAVLVLAEPGRAVEDLGGSVARNMASAAETADRVPVAGDALAKPFQALGDAGSSVRGAGQHAQDAVGPLALVLAVLLVLLPVGWLLLRWLPGRWRYAREAGAAARLLRGAADLEVLAVRGPCPPPPPPAGRPPGRHRRRLAGRRRRRGARARGARAGPARPAATGA